MSISTKRSTGVLLGLLSVGCVILVLRLANRDTNIQTNSAPLRGVVPVLVQNAGATAGEVRSTVHAEPIPYGGVVARASHTPGFDSPPGERVRVIRTTLKYPMVRVVDWVGGDSAGRHDAISMVADHILVKVRPGQTEADLAAFNTSCRTTIRKQMLAPRTYVIQLPDDGLNAVPQAVEVYRRQSDLIEYAEPDYMVTASSVTPNDTNFSALWGMHNTGQTGGLTDADIDAPEAWSIGTGSRTIKVGVIDSGIDYNHPDLAANIWANPGESGGSKPTNGIDDDGNGFIDDVRGWDFMSDDKDPNDFWAHGTHVAGTIGAVGNNSSYVSGVCWQVTLVPIKAVDFAANGGAGYISDTADATYYATKIGCHLTCNSYGGAAYSKVMEDAIRDAHEHGILFVASAGNETRNTDLNWRYPSCYEVPNIICVGASDHNDQPAAFDYPWTTAGTDAETNYGFETVDVFAPGSFIYSTYPTAKTPLMTSQNLPINYGQLSGTSMSAPHVAGACALLMSQAPTLSHLAVKNAILGTADPKVALTGKCVTGARLNLNSALLASQQAAVSIGSQVIDDDGHGSSTGNGDGLVNPGETIELRISLRNVGAAAANDVTASLALMSPNPHVSVQAGGVGFGNLATGEESALAGSYLIQIAGNAPVPLLTQMLLTITDSGGHTWTQAVALTVYNSSSVSGTVRRNDGEPMEGAEVVVTGLGRRTTLTDGLGMYSIPLPEGFSYQMAVRKDPFMPVSNTFALPPEAANMNFTMHRFRSVDLGTLGGSWAYASAINDAGQIVGASTNSAGVWRGFLWQNNSMVALDPLLPANRPFDINNKGEIVAGQYLYKAGTVSRFAVLGANDYATAINDLGTIGGRRLLSGPGFLYKDGTLSQFVIDSPPDINSRGQAVGRITGTGAAMVQNGQTTVLPSPVGVNPAPGIAKSINDAEVAAGYTQRLGSSDFRATLWKNGSVQLLSADMPDIRDSEASEVNEGGLISGKFWKLSYSTDGNGRYNHHGCFWDAGNLVDVHGLGPNLGKSWTTGLSNAGAILGNWSNKDFGVTPGGPQYESRAYAIVPVITCVEMGSHWRFLAPDTPPAGNWNTPAADDSGWPEGPGILGYGESYVNTSLPFGSDPQNKRITTYFRKSFNVQSNPSRMTELALSVCYDDGFIVYLNGQVVANRNIPVGAGPGDLAQPHESNNPIAPDQPVYERIDLSAHNNKLVRGTNVIAVELHQASASSDDLVWDAEMTYETWRHPTSAGAFVMDYDEDGLPDDFEWHIINHSASDPVDTLAALLSNGDYDGDGTTNADEFVAGTDGTSATDYLHIKGTGLSLPLYRITVDGKTGRTYFMERSTDLSAPWTVVDQTGPLAGNQQVELSDPEAPNGSAFYRVRVSN